MLQHFDYEAVLSRPDKKKPPLGFRVGDVPSREKSPFDQGSRG
jgi:hypothetical protein